MTHAAFNLALTPELEKYGWGLACVGIIMVSLSLFMRMRKRHKAGGAKVTARENLERYKAKGQVKDDLERVMVEVEQMAKRVASQLDAKTIAVERLLAEADAKIAELKALQAQGGGSPQPTGAGAPHIEPPRATEATAANAPSVDAEKDELTRNVYTLADEGLTPPDIARKLDEHVGKVELILALRSA